MTPNPHHLVVALGSRRYRVERPFGRLPATIGRASDVAVTPDGRVHVLLRPDPLTDGPEPRVVPLDPDGTPGEGWGADLVADGHMLAAAPDGRLLIVDRDAHEVVICSTDGERLGGLGGRHRPLAPFNHPTNVALAPDGTIYVADGYAAALIHRFAPDGTPLGTWGRHGAEPGAFRTPHGLWVLPDGRVVVADRENDRLQVFSPEGALLGLRDGFAKPMDVWGDAAGRVYVSDQVPSLTLLSGEGPMLGSVIGRCRPVLNGAHGLCGDTRGRLYLAEINPSRVTRLVPLPEEAA